MQNIAIILAGGTGSRAGGDLPKQFRVVGGKRLFWYSVEAFHRFDSDCRILLVVHPDFLRRWEELFGDEERSLPFPLEKTAGGMSRIRSVRNALKYLDGEEGRVFIHDAARPLVTSELIYRGAGAFGPGVGAVPVIPLSDSIRKLERDGSIAVKREEYVAVQTPQVFLLSELKAAYDALVNEDGFTDDASVGESYGLKIVTFPGDPDNIKITNPSDFQRLSDFNRLYRCNK